MAFNINQFKANGLVYGGARPSLFEVIVSPPPTLGLEGISLNKFSFVARAAELPASKVSSFDVNYFGRAIKLAGDRTFDDWTVTVLNDEDFSVRAMFEKWLNAINSMITNIRNPVLFEEGYKSVVDINQYAKDGEIIRSYQLIGAFPTNVAAIALDWGQKNQTEEFGVTFSYDYWIPIVESSSKKAGGVNAYGNQL